GFGEGAITAWYLSRIAIATVTVPYTNHVAPAIFAQAPHRNFIDDLVLEKLRELNLPPSPRCQDEEFIRRAFLAALGTLPTADEVRAFLADCHRERDASSKENRSEAPAEAAKSTDAVATSLPRSGADSFTPASSISARDRLIDSLLHRPEFVDYWT